VPNNPTLPALVNDLNIRILDSNAYDPINGTYDPNNGNIFKPFLLDPTNPAAVATKGVDNINNVEQVYIAPDDLVAGETYTIEVSHAGSLLDGEQAYSLIFAEGANDYLGCSNPMGVVEDTVQYCPDGSSVQLEAFGGENGGSYRWEPSSGSGLSNPNIANPTLDATVLNGEAATYVVTTIDANGCWHKTKVVVEPLICLEDCDIYIAHNPPSITDTDVILSIEDDLPDVEKYYWVIKGPLDLNSTNTFNPETCGHNYASSEFVDIRNTTTTPILEINYAESAANDEPIVPDGVYCVCVVVRYQSGECFTERLCQKMVLDPIGCFGDDPQDYDISYSQNGNLITVDPIASQYYIDNVITWALRDGNTLSLFDAAIPADENDPVVLQAPTSGLYNLELTIYASNPDCADQVVRTLLYVTTPCKTDEDIITNFTDGDQTEVVVSNGIQGYTDIESGADIIFNAGGSVCLFPGFKAEHGSVFCGKIEGCNQSNKETEVPSLESSNEISIYPNPTEDRFTLEYKLEQAGNVSFEIYNISGKLEKVLQPKRYLEAGFQSSNITIEDLSPGIYLIQGMIGSKQVIQKLVKM